MYKKQERWHRYASTNCERYITQFIVVAIDRHVEMDLFGGWPFYHGTQRSWNDPRHGGCYGRRPHAPMEQPVYDDYYPDNDWYPDMYSNPFYRPKRRPSPFETRRPTPFDSMFTEPRKPTRRECRHCPEQNVNNSPSPRREPRTVNVECQDAGEKAGQTEAMQTEPVTKKTTNDQAESSPATKSEEAQSKASTSELSPEIKKINKIVEQIVELESSVSTFEGARGSKQYVFIEESLVSLLLQLDNVETNGNIDIRKARKSAVCQIQQLLSDLEDKTKPESNSVKAEDSSGDKGDDGLKGEAEDSSKTIAEDSAMEEAEDSTEYVAVDGSKNDTEDVSISEDMLIDAEVKDTGTEIKDDNTGHTVDEASNAESSITEALIVDPTTPTTEMDTGNLWTEVVEDVSPSDEEPSETPAEDVDSENTPMDIATAQPAVISPSDDEDGLSEETATEEVSKPLTEDVNTADASTHIITSQPTVTSPSDEEDASSETVTE